MTLQETEGLDAMRALKRTIRVQAEACRQRQDNKEELSRKICEVTIRLPEYCAAETVLVFVGRPSEIQTQHLLTAAWDQEKQVVVPCCRNGELELYRIESLGELAPRTLGILEPRVEIRRAAERRRSVQDLSMAVVPGLAFDRRGGRLGHGKGYYDALLSLSPPEMPVIGWAFESQVFPEVPMMDHDVYLHKIITEDRVYIRADV